MRSLPACITVHACQFIYIYTCVHFLGQHLDLFVNVSSISWSTLGLVVYLCIYPSFSTICSPYFHTHT